MESPPDLKPPQQQQQQQQQLNQLKRKRSISDHDDHDGGGKRLTHYLPSPTTPTPPISDLSPPKEQPAKPTTTATIDMAKLRTTLSTQLDLEILLKHNELRFIDQEMAKCQIGLEQLRRCAEIPYPGSSSSLLSPLVSAGSGKALLSPNNTQPMSPAPWGVRDGPYTSHYAKWLLPDPRFDGGISTEFPESSHLHPSISSLSSTERSSSIAAGGGGKTRPSRTSTSTIKPFLQSLPTTTGGYPPARAALGGPMIVRRKSDNVLVKLVCLDCRRENFSSAQGFINHCRISHNRNFASHDAAASAAGEPVDQSDVGSGGDHHHVVNSAGGGYGDGSVGAATSSANTVHPLIRSAHGIEHCQQQQQQTPTNNNIGVPPRNRKQQPSTVKNISSSSLSISPEAPNLSSLMRRRGVGVDLGELVDEVKDPVHVASDDEEEEEAEEDPDKEKRVSQCFNKATTTTTTSPPTDEYASQPPPTTTATDIINPLPPTESDHTSSSSSSPSSTNNNNHNNNLTIESNQAPSLVSDDDDDDDDEEYGGVSDPEGPGSSGASEEAAVINVEGDEMTVARADANTKKKKRSSTSQLAAVKSGSGGGGKGKGKDQQHEEENRVSFGGSSKSSSSSDEKDGRKDGHQGRR